MGLFTIAVTRALDLAAGVPQNLFRIFGGPGKPPEDTRPSTVVVQQWQPIVVTNWTVESVLGALNQHEIGHFQQSALLAQSFGRDDRITPCRGTRVKALVGRNGVGFKLEASKQGDQRRADSVRKEQEEHWDHAHPEPVLSRVLNDAIDIGVSISRIHWDRPKKGAYKSQWIPRLEPWEMQHVYWSEIDLAYVVNTRTGPMVARQGTGEWLVYEPAGQFGWMSGAVRAMALPFLFRAFSQADWARWCEKHGVPILAITEPAEDADVGEKDKKAFYKRLRDIGKSGILRLPQDKEGRGFGAKMLDAKDTGWQGIRGFLVQLDTSIAIYYLGQNLSTEVKGGSHAAAMAQDKVRLDYLSADAETLSHALRRDVWIPWGRFNHDWWEPEICSYGVWNTQPPDDMGKRAMTFDRVGSGLTKFKIAGTRVDTEKLAETYAIPLMTEEQIAEAEAKERTKALKDAAHQKKVSEALGIQPGNAAEDDKGGDNKDAPASADDDNEDE